MGCISEWFKVFWLAGLFFCLSIVASSACQVTRDDGTVFDDGSGYCADYYRPNHVCHLSAKRPTACSTLDMFVVVDWDGVDMINNTHRGIWGLTLGKNIATKNPESLDSTGFSIGGAPENTFSGAVQSDVAGFRSVEFDIFPMAIRDQQNNVRDYKAVVSHLTDPRGFSSYSGVQILADNMRDGRGFLLNNHEGDVILLRYKHRDRNGSLDYDCPSEDPFDCRFIDLDTFFEGMRRYYNGMAIVLDVKWAKPLKQFRRDKDGNYIHPVIAFGDSQPIEEQRKEVYNLILDCLLLAEDIVMEGNIIFKVPQAMVPDPNDLQMFLISPEHKYRLPEDNRVAHMTEALWAPQPDAGGRLPWTDPSDPGNPEKSVKAYVDGWIEFFGGMSDRGVKGIAFWDTSLQTIRHWQARPLPGESATDLMDYLRQKSGRRSAVWVIDPAGPLGRNGNYGMSWNQYGNITPYTDQNGKFHPGDTRGDIQAAIGFRWGKNAVFTTDNPQNALILRTHLKKRYGIIK